MSFADRLIERVTRTGWPPGLLQDDSRELSRWFSSRPDARQRVREAADAIRAAQSETPPGKGGVSVNAKPLKGQQGDE